MEAWETFYRLPVTTVTIAGTRTIVDNPVNDPREVTTRVAEVGIEILADPDSGQRLRIQSAEWSKRTVTVGVKPDGRLNTVSCTSEDQSAGGWKSALSVGTSAFGSVASVLGPTMGPVGVALAAAAGVATAAGVAVVSGKMMSMAIAEAPSEAEHPPPCPSPTELGIHGNYVRIHPQEAQLLANLRFSHAILVLRRSTATHLASADGAKALTADLRSISKSLRIVTVGLEEAEARYAAWIAAQTTIKHEDRYHRVFTLDELPTEQVLREAARRNFSPVGTSTGPAWLRLFENLRMAVSVDILGPAAPPPGAEQVAVEGASADGASLVYRPAQLARIIEWKIQRTDDLVYLLEQEVSQIKTVILPGTEHHLPLLQDNGKRTLSVNFDDDGIVSYITFEQTGARAQRAHELREVPSILGDGMQSGAGLGRGWQSVTGDALTNNDVLDELRKELEEAELRARLARARVIISEPTRGLSLFYSREQSHHHD